MVAMETLNASVVKNTFGEVLIKTQQGPIGINKNGKPVAVLISASAYAEIELLREKVLAFELKKGMDAVEQGKVVDGPQAMEELKQNVINDDL